MTELRKKFDDMAGRICEAAIPVRHEYYIGRGVKTAICTLSSINLLEKISASEVMDRVAIAGRLLSENKGIDAMIKFVVEHPELEHIVVCGKEVKGHKAGQALMSLYKNGVGAGGRIVGAEGPYPILKAPLKSIDTFRRQVRISDMTGLVDFEKIKSLVT